MFELDENERIDWFRIIADLRGVGVTGSMICKELDIPRSTLQGWKNQIANPRFEPGMRLIEYWSTKCKKKPGEAPKYDVFQPH